MAVATLVLGGAAAWSSGCGSSSSTSPAPGDAGMVLHSSGSASVGCVPSDNGCNATSGSGSGGSEASASSGSVTHSSTGSGTGSGGAPTGPVGVGGGTVSHLYFASTGDTRPSLPPIAGDTTGYPTAIIDQIFSDIAALNPPPTFAVTTGDYQLAITGASAAAQLDLYLQARAKFPGIVFYGMGNHECSPVGLTTSNCGNGNADGLTANYTAFLSTMLTPIQQPKPYYVIKINATDGSWTSKFVFVAANAWDSTQQSWLTTAMAETTTYTFVIRHEATDANTAPGVTPSEAIISQYPVTLEICGHVHDYSHTGNRVVLGNGGAPLTGTGDYGFGTFQQREDGAIVVDEVDYMTGATDPSFHFVVTPAGAITQ